MYPSQESSGDDFPDIDVTQSGQKSYVVSELTANALNTIASPVGKLW